MGFVQWKWGPKKIASVVNEGLSGKRGQNNLLIAWKGQRSSWL